ncbi:unnamed protein product [Lactuca virosa]|uniref:Uncharacterized protein n=1 Tax=Lactuca virosa TaxID=75947 RepID=A0AAU9LT43_9ASTR|nr:unnamed protein product [Lactuca virosa]
MSGIDKEPIDSVSVCDPAYEGKSSILDQSVQETDLQNALDYARSVYKSSLYLPLARVREARDKAFEYFRYTPRAGAIREKVKQNIRDALQATFKDALKEAHEEAFLKALVAFDFATRVVGSGAQEYKRCLEEFMTNEYEAFEDSQCKRAMEHAAEVFNSVLNTQSHMMMGIVKEPIGSISVRRSARKGNNQFLVENALDHAKDVYKSSFKPPVAVLAEAGNKAVAAFRGVAEYKDAIEKTHEEAASSALLAFESTAGAVGSVKEKYKRLLEDFMRNEYEGFEESENRRILAHVLELLKQPLDIQHE